MAAGCAGNGSESDYLDSEADGDESELDEAADQLAGAADSPVPSGADAATVDVDGDGIGDAIEEMLLRRYRPYLKWSSQERFGPASAVTEVMHSQLKTYYLNSNGTTGPLSGCGRSSDGHLDPPEQLFSCRTDTSMLVSPTKSTYCLNLDNARYAGVSLDEAAVKATGLYGHVSPLKYNNHDAYQIEYWQFFPFNGQDVSLLSVDTFGDHEGDWTSVQLVYDRVERRLAKIRYLIHGKEVTFTIPKVATTCRNCTIEIKGKNYRSDLPNVLKEPAPYSDNAAQFFIDEKGYRHVVVYVERGGHEFWPFPWGYAAHDAGPIELKLNEHKGDGKSYLVPDTNDHVFNLGEVAKPMGRAGKLILWFNGLWGCTNTKELMFTGPLRRSPDGPALHCSWNYPDGTKIAGCSI